MKRNDKQRKEFTSAELKLIQETPLANIKDLAFMLNRSVAAIRRKKWMLENPDRDRDKKKMYRRKVQEETLRNASSNNSRWTKTEEEEILKSKLTDMELAKKLGRTISAIQVKRMRMLRDKKRKKK